MIGGRVNGGRAATRRCAVICIAHGRRHHLARQLWGLTRQTHQPDTYVVVAMDDPHVRPIVESGSLGDWTTRVPCIARRQGRLPLAAARNEGARTALSAGAETLIFLDVDCIPAPELVQGYTEAMMTRDDSDGDPATRHPRVLCGHVGYLPPLPPGADYRVGDLAAVAALHPARPLPLGPGATRLEPDTRLFWSLSFAITAEDWATIGGFDERYLGYGGEDTDFGQRLARARGQLFWVGGAEAFHQHHPTSSPPVEHLPDIVDNANLFAHVWGWWPMQGWLDAFEAEGLVRRGADGWYARCTQASSSGSPGRAG